MKLTTITILALILLVGCGVNIATLDIPDSVYQDSEETAIGGDWDDLGAYRPIYYVMGKPFLDIVGRDAYFEWDLSRSNEDIENECVAVTFIKEFDVSKEDFAKANEELRQIWLSTGSSPEISSSYEVYPVDLIYTFDNDAINEYFLWENSPIQADHSLGKTRAKAQTQVEE